MDPQRRLLLQETWRCLEDEGVSVARRAACSRLRMPIAQVQTEYHPGRRARPRANHGATRPCAPPRRIRAWPTGGSPPGRLALAPPPPSPQG